jgi:hypothetical protein
MTDDVNETAYVQDRIDVEHVAKSIWRYVLAPVENGIVNRTRDSRGVQPNMDTYGSDMLWLEVFDDPEQYVNKFRIVDGALVPYTPPPELARDTRAALDALARINAKYS